MGALQEDERLGKMLRAAVLCPPQARLRLGHQENGSLGIAKAEDPAKLGFALNSDIDHTKKYGSGETRLPQGSWSVGGKGSWSFGGKNLLYLCSFLSVTRS